MVDAATWNANALPVELRLVKETARRFADELLRPLAAQRAALPHLPDATCRTFAELGLGLVRVPQELGGVGLGPLAACLADEAMAGGDVNAAFALPQPGPFVDLVALLGNRQQRAVWLHPYLHAAAGTWGALALAPRGALTARNEGDGLRLSGEVPAVWGSLRAERLAVVADEVDGSGRATGRLAAAVLEREVPGLVVGAPLALDGLPLASASSVRFADVRVAKSQVLAEADVEAALVHVVAAQALRMASYALGTARAASAYVLDFAESQRRAKTPLPHYQSMAFLLVDMHLAVESALGRLREVAASASAAGLGRTAHTGDGPAPLDAASLAALHKARAEADEVAYFVTDGALQILHDGPKADDATHPVAGWHRDVTLLARTYPPAAGARADGGASPWLS